MKEGVSGRTPLSALIASEASVRESSARESSARESSARESSARELTETEPASATGARATTDATPDLDRIYVEYFHHVSRWARAFGGLDADLDDLAQEVFLVVRRKLPTYLGPSMQAWLYGITRKTVSDYRRRAFVRRLLRGIQRSIESSPQAARTSGPDPFARLEARQAVSEVLKRMSAVRRAAFILFEIEGYTGEEIAELEQVPLATVYTRLHHARRDFLRLTAELTGLPNEEPPP
jgi:RNA polymerase sigma-70 factor (ECF subfamily)